MTERHRTHGTLTAPVVIPKQSLWLNCEQNSWTTDANVEGSATGTVKAMDDVVIPNFHKRRKGGEIFFNPLYSFSGTYECVGEGAHIKGPAYACTGVNRQHEAKWLGPFVGYVARQRSGSTSLPPELYPLSAGDIQDAKIEASTRMLAERGRSTGNLWESIAEADKSFKMIYELATRALDMYSYGKKGFAGFSSRDLLPNIRGNAKGFSNDYLMYRYGIRPLLMDIAMILKGLSKNLGKRRQTTRARVELGQASFETFVGSYGVWRCGIDIQTNDSSEISAISLDEYYATLAQNIGLSLKGLLVIPLELVSYSFVADWFLTLGDVLRASMPSLEYKQLGSCLVEKRETSTICTVTSTSVTNGYTIITPFSGFASAYRKQVIRGPVTDSGVVLRADFRLSNLTRAADSIALLHQKFSGVRFK